MRGREVVNLRGIRTLTFGHYCDEIEKLARMLFLEGALTLPSREWMDVPMASAKMVCHCDRRAERLIRSKNMRSLEEVGVDLGLGVYFHFLASH